MNMSLTPRTLFVLALFAICCPGRNADAAVLDASVTAGRLYNLNLTKQGTVDWAVWGVANNGTSTSLTPDVRKIGGSAISALTNLQNNTPLRGIGQFGDYGATNFVWTDGTPTRLVVAAYGGIQHVSTPATDAIGEGFAFTVPADPTARSLSMYFTSHLGISTISATLSDGSAPAFQTIFDAHGSNNVPGILTVDYAAASPGQTLTVTGVLSSYGSDTTGYANFAIQAVTLASVPEPATLGALSVTIVGLLRRRRL